MPIRWDLPLNVGNHRRRCQLHAESVREEGVLPVPRRLPFELLLLRARPPQFRYRAVAFYGAAVNIIGRL